MVAENPLFRSFISILNNSYHLVGADTVKARVMKKYEATRDDLKKELQSCTSKISFTIDLWDSKYQKLAYMAVTAHWMDNDWKIHNELLAFRYINKNHTGIIDVTR